MPPTANDTLVADLRQLIDGARHRAAAAVNAELDSALLADRRPHPGDIRPPACRVWRGDRFALGRQRAPTMGAAGARATCGCASASPRPTLFDAKIVHAVCQIELVAPAPDAPPSMTR